jgi:hypothetical protein
MEFEKKLTLELKLLILKCHSGIMEVHCGIPKATFRQQLINFTSKLVNNN